MSPIPEGRRVEPGLPVLRTRPLANTSARRPNDGHGPRRHRKHRSGGRVGASRPTPGLERRAPHARHGGHGVGGWLRIAAHLKRDRSPGHDRSERILRVEACSPGGGRPPGDERANGCSSRRSSHPPAPVGRRGGAWWTSVRWRERLRITGILEFIITISRRSSSEK